MESARWVLNALPSPGWTIVVAVVLWMLLTDRLVPQRRYDEVRRDRDYWRDRALKGDDGQL